MVAVAQEKEDALTLDSKRKREIRQLLFVAERYLSLAEPARNETIRRLGDTAAHFESGATPSREIQWLTLLAADLSSAAIRLATVDEVLCHAEAARPGYKACGRYFNREKRPDGAVFPDSAEWLHVMLRDSIGHNEPPEERVDDRAKRRGERQDLIESLSFAHTHETLTAINAKLRAHLQQEHQIELLT